MRATQYALMMLAGIQLGVSASPVRVLDTAYFNREKQEKNTGVTVEKSTSWMDKLNLNLNFGSRSQVEDAVEQLRELQVKWANRSSELVYDSLEYSSVLRRDTIEFKANLWKLQHDKNLLGIPFVHSWDTKDGYMRNAEALMKGQKIAIALYRKDTGSTRFRASNDGKIWEHDWSEVTAFRNNIVRQFYEVYCQTPWPTPKEDQRAWQGAASSRQYRCDEVHASKKSV